MPVRRYLGAPLDVLREFRLQRRSSSARPLDVGAVRAALEVLDASYPRAGDPDGEEPIFLLATGMRTGSTLLQRILVTDPRLLMWGEPLSHMALLPRLAEMLTTISPAWPPERYWIAEQADPAALAISQIATLFPPGPDFRAALRALLIRWLAVPARARGYARWGLKEVRLGAAEACLLHWLFPAARFLVLSRHPFDAYRSVRRWVRGQRRAPPARRTYVRWPDQPIDGAASFARHWNRLATSWLAVAPDFPHTILRYEDLIAGGVDFGALERRLGLRLDPARALSVRLEAGDGREGLAWHERRILLAEAGPGMRALGYPATWPLPSAAAMAGRRTRASASSSPSAAGKS